MPLVRFSHEASSGSRSLGFYANNTYSFGVYDSEEKMMMLKIIPAMLYVDEKPTSYLTSSQLILFSEQHEAI